MAVALLALGDDLSVEHVECGKQRGRAIALVVVRHGGCAPFLQRQARLRAIQRLYLALLVTAQHNRVLVRSFKISRDPKFVEKLEDVVALYLSPPEHAGLYG